MKIKIDCKVDLPEDVCLDLAKNLLKERKPKDGSYDYGLITYGVFELTNLKHPIHVMQTNKRLSDKSPIHILIEKHVSLLWDFTMYDTESINSFGNYCTNS